MSYRRYMRGVALLACCPVFGCQTPRMRIDSNLARRAEVIRPHDDVDREDKPFTAWGGYLVRALSAPASVNRLRSDGMLSQEQHYVFRLECNGRAPWTVKCALTLGGRTSRTSRGRESLAIDQAVESLSCEIARDGADLPWRLALAGTGPGLGLLSGDVRQLQPVLELRSSHGEPDGQRAVGPLVGFEVWTDDHAVASLQTRGDTLLWLDARSLSPELEPIVIAAVVALNYFTHLSEEPQVVSVATLFGSGR